MDVIYACAQRFSRQYSIYLLQGWMRPDTIIGVSGKKYYSKSNIAYLGWRIFLYVLELYIDFTWHYLCIFIREYDGGVLQWALGSTKKTS